MSLFVKSPSLGAAGCHYTGGAEHGRPCAFLRKEGKGFKCEKYNKELSRYKKTKEVIRLGDCAKDAMQAAGACGTNHTGIHGANADWTHH